MNRIFVLFICILFSSIDLNYAFSEEPKSENEDIRCPKCEVVGLGNHLHRYSTDSSGKTTAFPAMPNSISANTVLNLKEVHTPENEDIKCPKCEIVGLGNHLHRYSTDSSGKTTAFPAMSNSISATSTPESIKQSFIGNDIVNATKLGPNGEIYLNVIKWDFGPDHPDNTIEYQVSDKYGFRISRLERDASGNFFYFRNINGAMIREAIEVFFDSENKPYVKKFPIYSNKEEDTFYKELSIIAYEHCEAMELAPSQIKDIKKIIDKHSGNEEYLNLVLDEVIYNPPGDLYTNLTDSNRESRIHIVSYAFDTVRFKELPERFLYKTNWNYSSDRKLIEGVLNNIPYYLIGIESTQYVFLRNLDSFKIYLERDDLTAKNLDQTLIASLKSIIRLSSHDVFKDYINENMQLFSLLIKDSRFDATTLHTLLNNDEECEKQFSGLKAWDYTVENPCELLKSVFNNLPKELTALIAQRFAELDKKQGR